MEYRQVDITVISAEGIKNVNMFFTMDVYVVISVTGDYKIKKKTHIDKHGGTNPRWSHRIKLTLPDSAVAHQSLLFQIISSRAFGHKEIGIVSIPIRELLEDSATLDSNSGVEQVVDYQVRTTSGKSKGSLKFSYKFGEKITEPIVKANKKKVDEAEHVTAYPADMSYMHHKPGYEYQPGQAGGYHNPPPQYGGYPTCGYPPTPGYAYAPPIMGYAYPPVHQPGRHNVDHKIHGGAGGKLGLGLGAGLIGGLLVGEVISNVGDMAAYGAGYTAGFDTFDM